MAKRRYSEPFEIIKVVPQKDSTGGVNEDTTGEIEVLSGLALVNDNIRVRNNLDVAMVLNNAISFEFFCPSSLHIDLSMYVKWRNTRLNIQSKRTLPDVRKMQLICTYES